MILGCVVLFAITVMIVIIIMVFGVMVLDAVAVVIVVVFEQVDVTGRYEDRERDEAEYEYFLHRVHLLGSD